MKELLKIATAAKILGVAQSTLRRWEAEGLISPVRLPSGHRRFAVADIAKVLKSGKGVKTYAELQDWLQRTIDEGE